MQKNIILPLNGLKIIALLGIFIWHSNLPKPNIDIGARCCEFFFVTSGFLVAYNFYNKNFVFNFTSMIKYLKKKLQCIYPLHALTFIICLFLFNKKFDFIPAIFNILLLQSWTVDKNIFFGYNGISWFISSLLFCYFLAPLLMNFIQVNNIKKMVMLVLCVAIFRIFIEFLPSTTNYDLWDINYHINPVIRSLEFFIGMLILPFFVYLKNIFNIRKKLLFSFLELFYIILLLEILQHTNFIRGAYIPLIFILVLIFSLDKGYISEILSAKIFTIISNVELEFFMFHQIVIKLFYIFLPVSENIYSTNITILFFVIIVSYCYRFLYLKFSGFKKS